MLSLLGGSLQAQSLAGHTPMQVTRASLLRKAMKQLLDVERKRTKAAEKRCFGDDGKLAELRRKQGESMRPTHVCNCTKQRANLVIWAFKYVTGNEDPIHPDEVDIATWAVVGLWRFKRIFPKDPLGQRSIIMAKPHSIGDHFHVGFVLISCGFRNDVLPS